MRFEARHLDHGITLSQLVYICDQIEKLVTKGGEFILCVEIPPSLGTVPCGLYGPVMGDEPILDEDVVFWRRGDRPYADRCVDLPLRRTSHVQAIGDLDASGFCLLKTVFGGPLAPMNAEDPTCQDPEKSLEFWASHALSIPAEKDRLR